MERQTTPSIAGQKSLHKSLSPQREKSRIAIKPTVPLSSINFTPNPCALAVERLVKNKKIALKFALFGFPEVLVMGSATTAVRKAVSSSTLIGQWGLRMKPPCERPLSRTPSQEPQESRRGQILRQFFCSSRVFRPPRHTGLEWNLLSLMELLVLLRFGTFPFEDKAICGVTSDQRWMEWSAFPFF